jgi:hypothetical protein
VRLEAGGKQSATKDVMNAPFLECFFFNLFFGAGFDTFFPLEGTAACGQVYPK